MVETGVIYLTDNSLDERLAELVRLRLAQAADGLPVVSVSQQPVSLGTNICVGNIGRSWDSLYKQLLAGINALSTPYVVIAEHDCLYTPEHLMWMPLADDVFYYNANCWLVQWGGNHPELNGMYSYWPKRLALSQLICNRLLLKTAVEERLALLGEGKSITKQWLGCGEPGVVSERALEKARKAARSGRPIKLDQYLDQYLRKYTSAAFVTKLPNLDIRHSSNFTGPKRGKKRCYELPYWGRFETVFHA
jgi:hypothetical protein